MYGLAGPIVSLVSVAVRIRPRNFLSPHQLFPFSFLFFFNKFDLPRASNQRLDSTRFSFLLVFEHAINKYRFCRASVPRFSALYPFLTRIEFRMTRTKRMGSSIIFFFNPLSLPTMSESGRARGTGSASIYNLSKRGLRPNSIDTI